MKKENIRKFISEYSILFVMLLMVIIMTILKPDSFMTRNNILNVLRQISITGVIALGTAFPIIAKGIDVSGGSVVALSAVITGSMISSSGFGLPVGVGIMIGLTVGLLCGIFSGIMTAYGNVPPFITTLAVQLAARGLAQLYTNGKPVTNFPKSFLYLGGGSFIGIPIPILIFALMAVITFIILHKTKFGSYTYAIGGNIQAAVVSGIKVKVVTTMIYGYAGFMSALGGIILAARSTSALPSYGSGYEMDAITCAVIGGVSMSGGIGKVQKIVIGIIIVGILSNGMTMLMIDANWQTVVKGMVILLAVLFDQKKMT
ncbi:MAG: ABC transporter permease [Clostridiales bacterium]|nr:ABC transporter permease [Clostridiales bacterium]